MSSPLSWNHCFLAFVAIRCWDPFTRDMLAYARLILREAMCHGGSGWLDYDRAARQQRAIDPAKPWNVLDPGLHSSFILSRSSAAAVKCCTACQGSTTLLASVHWLLLSLLFSKLGWNPAAAATSAPPGIGGLAASLVLAATAMCAPFALQPTKPGNAHRQGAPRLHLIVGRVNRHHLSNVWWISIIVGLVIYGTYPIHVFH